MSQAPPTPPSTDALGRLMQTPAARPPNSLQLRPGDHVDERFACTGKQRRRARSGTVYLVIELRNPSGLIEAHAFRGAERLCAALTKATSST